MRVTVAMAGSKHHLCIGHALHNLVTVDGICGDPRLHELVQCQSLVSAIHYKAQQLELIVEQECRESIMSLIPVGEALETYEADLIAVSKVQDHECCVTSTVLHRPTVKGDVPTQWRSILVMFESLLNNHGPHGKFPRL